MMSPATMYLIWASMFKAKQTPTVIFKSRSVGISTVDTAVKSAGENFQDELKDKAKGLPLPNYTKPEVTSKDKPC